MNTATQRPLPRRLLPGVVAMAMTAATGAALADDGPEHHFLPPVQLELTDLDAARMAHDAVTSGMVSTGPSAEVIKNLAAAGRGERLAPNATTDVWALGKYTYTGTFNSPCGGQPDAGIFVWDVHNHNKITQAGFIPSPTGSRSNDVKVASMNSGDILVHPNEPCAGGPGRYHRSGPDFEQSNGGIQNVWGIYKIAGRPWIYASDRNGGLYVLKEYGAGSATKGKTE